MKKATRILSLALALVMVLPLLAVFTVVASAEEKAETNVIWAGENFDGATNQLTGVLPSTAQIVAKDASNPADKAFKMDIKGVAMAGKTAPYYAWNGHTVIYEITDYTYDAATNTVKGKFSNGTTTYDIAGTVDTGTQATCSAGKYYVYTPAMLDSRSGGTNVAKAVNIKNPKILSSENPVALFQYKIWFENGTKGVFASRIFTTGGKYVELIGFNGNGNNTVTLQQHENAKVVGGSTVSLATERWYTVSVLVDLKDSVRKVYLDGVYAFSTVSIEGTNWELPESYDLNASKWSLFQVNRGNTNAGALAGSVMIDDVCILNSVAGSVPATNDTDDFESYTSDKITAANGYNTVNSTAQKTIVAYNKLLRETKDGAANQFVRVPLLYDGTGTNAIGTAGYTNYDKTLQFGNAATSLANGKYAIFDIDYRHNSVTNHNATIEIQLRDYYFDMEASNGAAIKYNGTTTWEAVTDTVYNKQGIFLSLFKIELNTGHISTVASANTMTKTGATGLVENAWNHVQFVLDLETTAYRIYVNGIVYGYDDALNMSIYEGGKYHTVKNVSNLVIPEKQLIIAKVNKVDAAFKKLEEADETYSNVNYIDIDNVSFKSSNEMPRFVLPPVYASDNFEGYSEGTKLTTSHGYNAGKTREIVAYNKVLSETVNGKTNQFVRLPFVYDGTVSNGAGTTGYTNQDKSLQLKHETLSTQTGKYALFTVDYRPHAEENSTNATVEIQLRDFTFDALVANGSVKTPKGGTATALTSDEKGIEGIYLNLFTITLATGEVKAMNSGTTTTIGAPGLKLDEWNTIQFIMSLEDGSSRLYVNGILHSISTAPIATKSDWAAYTNPTNFVINPNKMLIAKLNKDSKLICYDEIADADENYSNVNYIDLDNVSIESTDDMLPILLPPVKASESFEGLAAGSKASAAANLSSSNLAYNPVMAETVSANENKFVRLPFVYDGTGDNDIKTAGYTNRDKSLYLKHGAISAETGKYAVITVDYRPHAEADNGSTATVEVQLGKYTFDALVANGSQMKPQGGQYADLTTDAKSIAGIYLNLFTINLETGAVNMSTTGTSELTGAPGMKADEWNTLQYVMNLEDASASLYINGMLYSTSVSSVATSSDWGAYTNVSNITVNANQIIVAKLNHKDSAGNPCYDLLAEADEAYSNVNYIDVDNIRIESATVKDVVSIPETNEQGEVLLYVEVGGRKVPLENLYLTSDLEYNVKYLDLSTINAAGILSTLDKASVRLKTPAGLRFVTEIVDIEKFEAIFALSGEDYKSVDFGHLIVPSSYVENMAFTVEALKAAGKNYLAVDGTYGYYYNFDKNEETRHFVGSIVKLKDANVPREFSATGYIRITLWSGTELYFYANGDHHVSVMNVAQRALMDDTQNYNSMASSILDAYAAGKGLSYAMNKDLEGLNVLALGDSLFSGTDKGTPGCSRDSQWVNLLGRTHGWTLTNLGIGGMTVSYTENNYTTKQHKSSMYDWLFNDINDFRWGTSLNTNSGTIKYPGTDYSYNYYFNCGDFTGKTAEDVDLIFLEGGCNDYGTEIAAPLGTIDSTDPGTFLGAWNCIVEKLHEQYPNATIIFITTWYLGNQSRPNDTLTSMEYSTSINRLYDTYYASCDYVQIIDAGNPAVSGVDMRNSTWRNEYSNDAYHLKNNGMEFMANNMLPYIWEIVMNMRDAK